LLISLSFLITELSGRREVRRRLKAAWWRGELEVWWETAGRWERKAPWWWERHSVRERRDTAREWWHGHAASARGFKIVRSCLESERRERTYVESCLEGEIQAYRMEVVERLQGKEGKEAS
jgi:hypothetical protein